MENFTDALTNYLRIIDEKGDFDNGETAYISIFRPILCASFRGNIKELQGMHKKMVEKEEERNGNVPPEFSNYKKALSAFIYFLKQDQ